MIIIIIQEEETLARHIRSSLEQRRVRQKDGHQNLTQQMYVYQSLRHPKPSFFSFEKTRQMSPKTTREIGVASTQVDKDHIFM
jgi:hypothetical protein